MFLRRSKKNVGSYGEKIAADHLAHKGYKIVETNFATKYGEIDIVAKDQDELVFVEVKSRTDTEYGYPETSIHKKKLDHLRRMAEIYIQNKHLDHTPYRIDAVSILLSGNDVQNIEHYVNISC